MEVKSDESRDRPGHRESGGREAFIVRVAEDAMCPRVQVGDYVRADPDEHGRPIAYDTRKGSVGPR